jgi:hypothetical protein
MQLQLDAKQCREGSALGHRPGFLPSPMVSYSWFRPGSIETEAEGQRKT